METDFSNGKTDELITPPSQRNIIFVNLVS